MFKNTGGSRNTRGTDTRISEDKQPHRTATTPCGSLFVVRITVTRYGSLIRLKPLPTSNTVHRCREPQSQHGANPDDSFGPLTGPSILTDPVIPPCSGLCKVTGREMEY